ncbi:MAG: hypothetical protein A2W03_06630 [Candidatus Aminicenantes bacterium RBG_16_63_16]|nr:MAG: hypothetical protein A2W03_06630 [Candidatus Aminicenantes bacterium RBG_16_63_16]
MAKKEKPLGAGHSSFDLIDSPALFKELRLKKGSSFLDIACGPGAYILAASEFIGPAGNLYGVDLWDEAIAALRREAAARGIKNLITKIADVGKKIPLPDRAVDAALMATVLHDLVEEGKETKALRETARVLKPGGLFAVVEFKKIDAPTGPPRQVRLNPREVGDLVAPFGFSKARFRDLGPDVYLMVFRRR